MSKKYRLPIYMLYFLSFIYPCRMWCLISTGNQGIVDNQNGLDFIISEANYFQEIGAGYNTWSLFYYNQELGFGDIYRSNVPANIDSVYQAFLNQSLNEESNSKILSGHLRAPSSGAVDIVNPHPFLFDYNNKTYSLMHNGTIDKTILVTLLTNNNSDSTWINNNPPNTYNNYSWSSDSGWVNVVDSELLLLWIMQNIEINENSELESIIHSIQELEAIQPNSDKNFIFSEGANIYAYRSDDDDISDLYYSDLTPISIDDSTYVPNFISIISQVPTTYPASQLSWNSFENESLMIIDNEANYYFINDFVNHRPQFESLQLNYTYWIMDDYNIVVNASDIDEDSLFFSIQNNPDWVVLENQTLYIYPEELGNFTFEVIVSDGELDEIKSITLNIVEYRPIINSVTDVPNDNGGWVYINFSKSYFDNNEIRNTEIYHIERLTDGDWISVGSSAAYGSENYTVQAMTEIDSSSINLGLTFFRVVASMDEGLWISEIDSGYSINNNYLDTKDTSMITKSFSISQNYPNPFNPITTLNFYLPEESIVNITIYDLMGNIVKEIVNQVETSGFKSVQWNGTNNKGLPVSAGAYIYGIETSDFRQTKKMILLK